MEAPKKKNTKKKKSMKNPSEGVARTESSPDPQKEVLIASLSLDNPVAAPQNAQSELSEQEQAKLTFEQELQWCINQLELGLKRKGLQKEQIAESKGLINKLQSPKVPMPQKRHLMHVVFGDYRKFMREEEKKSAALAASKATTATASIPSAATESTPSSKLPANCKVEFFDNFKSATTASPSSEFWKIVTGTQVPGGPPQFGTCEKEVFVSDTEHVWVDGTLHLKATRDANGAWYSGRIESVRSDFCPAAGSIMRVEARLNLPVACEGLGVWPAFWLLGDGYRLNPMSWPEVGELDILESVNCSGVVYGAMHGGKIAGGAPFNEPKGIGAHIPSSQICASIHGNWHEYALEWDRSMAIEQIRWYFDGKNYLTIQASEVPADQWDAATKHGFYIILKLAIGAKFPDALAAVATPTTSTTAPLEYQIEYVKVTSTAGLAHKPPSLTTSS